MKDRNLLKGKIGNSEVGNKAWEIVEGYLDGEYNQMSMFNCLLDIYGGDQRLANADAWEVSDWENG